MVSGTSTEGDPSGLVANFATWHERAGLIGRRALLAASLLVASEAAPASADQQRVVTGPDRTEIVIDEHCEDDNITALTISNKSYASAVTNKLSVGGRVDEFPMRSEEVQTRKYPVNAANMAISLTVRSAFNREGSDSFPSSCPYDASKGNNDDGYWLLDLNGNVYPFGMAGIYKPARLAKNSMVHVDIEAAPNSMGYWLTSTSGDVRAVGDAVFYGDTPPIDMATERIASLSRTPSGKGYWIFSSKGRVFTYGDAPFFGDMSGQQLNGPVRDSIATPSGKGYYMVASDGGVFSFGDARFYGSMGNVRLNQPVKGLVPDPDGVGYWLVARDGGVFSFEAEFRGSMGSTPLNKPMAGMIPYGDGYLMFAEDGGVFNFSNKPFRGSLGSNPPARPIVSVAPYDRSAA